MLPKKFGLLTIIIQMERMFEKFDGFFFNVFVFSKFPLKKYLKWIRKRLSKACSYILRKKWPSASMPLQYFATNLFKKLKILEA